MLSPFYLFVCLFFLFVQYQKPFLLILQKWDAREAVDYIIKLDNGKFLKYRDILIDGFTKQEITGSDLPNINKNDLLKFGIKNDCDCEAIVKEFQRLEMNTWQMVQQSILFHADAHGHG